MLFVAAGVQRLCNIFAHRWPSLRRVPQMAGMCAGWAFGGASVQALHEVSETCSSLCAYIHLTVSLIATAASAVLILVSVAARSGTCGRGEVGGV